MNSCIQNLNKRKQSKNKQKKKHWLESLEYRWVDFPGDGWGAFRCVDVPTLVKTYFRAHHIAQGISRLPI